jgi:hypothetical protein
MLGKINILMLLFAGVDSKNQLSLVNKSSEKRELLFLLDFLFLQGGEW